MGRKENSDGKSMGREIAEQLHSIFLESMENRYKEILGFMALLLPSTTGFLLMLHRYETAAKGEEPTVTFFVGTIAVMGIFLWGACYTLAISYRYRYLQASVYKIEKSSGAHQYIPKSFKPAKIKGFKKRVFFSITPSILQVHVFLFLGGIVSIPIAYIAFTPWDKLSLWVVLAAAAALTIIAALGFVVYPAKMNNIVDSLE
ncbi:MAG: hypothetical protein V3U84_03935 [Thiotrichaceae bacterium]